MSWLVVTPARNEADRLPALARSLAAQSRQLVGQWVVVDDGSSDGTAAAIPNGLPFPVHVVRCDNSGGLASGSEFAAFLAGAELGLGLLPDAERVMKLDADIVLAHDYFERIAAPAEGSALVAGRIVQRGEQTRTDYARGSLKSYSRNGFELIRTMPVALGWDVLDEVALRAAGECVRVVPEARAMVTRRTGSSEGALPGRRRAGVVSRWTGYHPVYFALRLLRFSLRRPVVIGSIAMAWTWATAGPGPFAPELTRAHRAEQISRLRRSLRRGGSGRATTGRSRRSARLRVPNRTR